VLVGLCDGSYWQSCDALRSSHGVHAALTWRIGLYWACITMPLECCLDVVEPGGWCRAEVVSG